MTLRIDYFTDASCFDHRDTMVDALVDTDVRWINGISVIVVRLISDNLWWVIARSYDDDYRYTDLGPYDDAETAMMYMKLMAD